MKNTPENSEKDIPTLNKNNETIIQTEERLELKLKAVNEIYINLQDFIEQEVEKLPEVSKKGAKEEFDLLFGIIGDSIDNSLAHARLVEFQIELHSLISDYEHPEFEIDENILDPLRYFYNEISTLEVQMSYFNFKVRPRADVINILEWKSK